MKRRNKVIETLGTAFGVLSIDWLATTLAVFISIVGIMTIYSATRTPLSEGQPEFYLKQTIWLLIGLILMLAVSGTGYRRLHRITPFFYVFAFVLFLATLVVGHVGMGAKRWLRLGPFNLQPSELLRIATILALGAFLSRINGPLRAKHFIAIFLVFVFLPSVVFYFQPDLGSCILLGLIVLFMVVIKGLQRRLLIGLVAVSIIGGAVLGPVFWNYLKPYQRNRIIAFLEPEADPTGIGYQIAQSKVTIGSGRWTGKGYLKGTQGPLRFLPERHTDFIFSVFAEEWGFVGSLIVLLAYVLLIIRGFETAYYAKDSFGFFVASGISGMFLIYFSINLGMTMGLLPVVGIPLPFFSYGGTALVVNFLSIGLLNSIRGARGRLLYG